MKKFYEIPAIELTKFDVEDVITASTGALTEEEFKDALTGNTNKNVVVTTWNSDWDSAFGGI